MQIMVAPNGARKTTTDHPKLPVTLSETVAAAVACHRAGADALHLHVRGRGRQHSICPGLYREAMAELALQVPEMPVQITTESAGVFGPEAQLACLEELRPAWASVALRELAADPTVARRVYALAQAHGIRLQHIVYDQSDARLLARWQGEGVLGPQEEVLLVLGRYTSGQQSDPRDVAAMLESLPPVGRWMLCAFGPQEHACLLEAARLGGDLRVGFENAHVDAEGTPWPDVAASVRSLREKLNRQVASSHPRSAPEV